MIAENLTKTHSDSGEELDSVENELISATEVLQSELRPEEVTQLVNSNNVVVLRRSFVSEGLRIAVFLLSIALALWATYALPATVLEFEIFQTSLRITPLALLPLYLFGVIVFTIFNDRFLITDDDLVVEHGILSPIQKSTVRVPYKNVQAMEVTQTLYQRIVNVGDIRISTTLFDQPEIVFFGIFRPAVFRKSIRKKLRTTPEQDSSIPQFEIIQTPPA